jgi:cation:H+ antiporter
MALDFITVLFGIAIILGLSEIVIRSAIELAEHFKLSGTFIGLTVLAIGTSIPEIFTHVVGSIAILQDPETMNPISGLVVGTNIGSDIFQQNFVLPVVGLVGVIIVKRASLVREIGAVVGSSLLTWIFCLGGLITRLEGAILIIAYVAYVTLLAKQNHLITQINNNGTQNHKRTALSLFLILLSFIIMAIVTDRVVDSSTRLVALLPVSASFFGVLVLGVACALPELTTSLISIYKGHKGISAGILIGSNITTPLLGIGIGALISKYSVANVIVSYDMPIKVGTAILLYIFLRWREDLNKYEAWTLILCFLVYIVLRGIYFPNDIHAANP